MFKCEKCGMCCRNLDKSDFLSKFHNGDGVCIYLDGNLCSIYESRPLFCRIDEGYEKLFKNKFSLEEYYDMNYKICETLKKKK